MLATGGFGRCFKITSNSWEYSGDGQALAYKAGAELKDMEFFQFHPTGMVWPPSVRGILVTEGVRGEGGVLRNSEGKRFMFDDIPPLYKHQVATDAEEGWRYVTGDKNAKRPPELLTRDHVARCINREVKAGRGSPHGGVFLDISWIKEKIPNAPEHIRKKLPSMYHQFKQLAELDITVEPMEVGPTAHYAMGGINVDGDTQMATTVPGLFAAGEVAAGLHGANRLGGNSLSDLIVFGKLAGEHAAKYARDASPAKVDEAEVQRARREALASFERQGGESPSKIQQDLQEMMQAKVGIIREEKEMLEALDALKALAGRAQNTSIDGNRHYNSGWHTAIDIGNLLVCAEATTRCAIERKESRGAQARSDYPDKSEEYGKFNLVVKRGPDGEMQVRREPCVAIREDLKAIIEEQQK